MSTGENGASAARPEAAALLHEYDLAQARGDAAVHQLQQLDRMHDELLELAGQVNAEAMAEFGRRAERLADYDRETERVLAETSGRVKSLRAQIAHASMGTSKGELDEVQLKRDLGMAEIEDQAAVRNRLHGSVGLKRSVDAARAECLRAGATLWSLAQRLVPSLELIASTGRAAQSCRQFLAEPSRANGEHSARLEAPLLRLDRAFRRSTERPESASSGHATHSSSTGHYSAIGKETVNGSAPPATVRCRETGAHEYRESALVQGHCQKCGFGPMHAAHSPEALAGVPHFHRAQTPGFADQLCQSCNQPALNPMHLRTAGGQLA